MSEARFVTISGSAAGVGKTGLIERLVHLLPECAAVKVRSTDDTRLRIVREHDIADSPGKDTSRFLAAGASVAYFVEGEPEETARAVRGIAGSAEFQWMLVESNTLAGELPGALHIFVEATREEKETAARCRALAELVIKPSWTRGVADMNEAQKEQVREAITQAAEEGRITCRDAHALAETLEVEPGLVGRLINELGIKIEKCQLGCF